MTATMTWVGLDVHARSTHAAAIDREGGELTRALRRGCRGGDDVAARAAAADLWLLRGRPDRYALYRATEAAGLRLDVVVPSKTPAREQTVLSSARFGLPSMGSPRAAVPR